MSKKKIKNYPYETVKMVCENCAVMAKKFPDQAWLNRHLIDRVLRKLVDIEKPIYVSKAALKKAKQMNINLKELTWDNQKTVDPKREIFIAEHCNPLSTLANRLIAGEKFKDIKPDIFTAWITKEEDQALRDHHYRSRRPGGWKKCYKLCEIKVVKL